MYTGDRETKAALLSRMDQQFSRGRRERQAWGGAERAISGGRGNSNLYLARYFFTIRLTISCTASGSSWLWAWGITVKCAWPRV
jgi:hypothetical protein